MREEEMKELFKPKINQNHVTKRETIFNPNGSTDSLQGGAIVSGMLTL